MTPQEIEKIAEKWAFKAAEEAENSGGFDVPDQFIEFIVGAIAEATDHLQAIIECHERGDAMLLELVAPYKTIAEGINAIKSTAPTWTKELPKEPGFYWWTDGQCTPKILTLDRNCFGDMCVVHVGKLSLYYPGYWSRITPPQPPQDL